jgi:hypothetical protein
LCSHFERRHDSETDDPSRLISINDKPTGFIDIKHDSSPSTANGSLAARVLLWILEFAFSNRPVRSHVISTAIPCGTWKPARVVIELPSETRPSAFILSCGSPVSPAIASIRHEILPLAFGPFGFPIVFAALVTTAIIIITIIDFNHTMMTRGITKLPIASVETPRRGYLINPS